MRCTEAVIGLALCLLLLPAWAQVPLANPGIPAHETLVYSERTGDRNDTVRQEVTLKNGEGRSWYEVQFSQDGSDITYRVDSQNLRGFFAEVLEKSKGSTVRRVTEVLSFNASLQKDEVLMSDVNSFLTSLRGFPFGQTNYAKVVIAGNPAMASGYTMELSVQGKETLKLNGTAWECWKVQFGLSGFLGNMMPKSQYWYATRPPHVMVRFEGVRSGMGGPTTVMELQSYQADN